MVLNVGDVVYRYGFYDDLNRYKVIRTTPKQATLNNFELLVRYSESSIYVYGAGASHNQYLLETDELKAQFEIQKENQKFISLMEEFRIKLPLAALAELREMLAEVAEQKTA